MRPDLARPRRARRLLLALALGGFAGLLAGCGASTIPAVHSEPERLAEGRLALQRHEYNVSLELLKSYVENNAGGADVDQAIELLGESYLRIKEWSEAQSQFERLLRDYPESDSAAAASYHLGVALWGQSRGAPFDQEYTQKALEQWENYLRAYPGHWQNVEAGKRREVARERLADKLDRSGNLYLKLRKPGPARVYFQRVLDEYPDTSFAANASLGMALADALEGKRDEALAVLRDLRARSPGKAVGERAAKEIARLERQAAKKK